MKQNNPAQTEAICHGDGPMLVIAGPGSGKTYVITNRICHLIEEFLVPPEQILVITFSRAAAEEMQLRFGQLCNHAYPGVTFGTFHACFFRILRHAKGYRTDDILQESDAVEIVANLLADIRPDYVQDRSLVHDICAEILKLKCTMSDADSRGLEKYEASSCDTDTFRKLFPAYLRELRNRRKLDFEDMLILTKELLLRDGDALSFWRSRYRYLLVDEFQDVNRLQYEIVRLLAGPSANLFAVGDDDQAIYGFRGSDPRVMLEFPKDFPEARVLTLPVNYRSTPQIVSAADALISNNRLRYDKTHTTAHAEGSLPAVRDFDTVSAENEFLLGEIARLSAAGTPLSQIAILFRTNLQMRCLRDLLQNAGIAHHVRGFLPSLWNDAHVQTAIAYLRAGTGDMRRTVLLSIANRPKRYIERRLLTNDPVDLAAIAEAAEAEGRKYLADNIDRLRHDLAMLSGMNPFAAVNYIRRIIGLDRYCEETMGSIPESLDELTEIVRNYRTVPQLLEALDAATGREQRRMTRSDKNGQTGVSLMTFHASKGLEFDHVYICDCNETIVPHKKALHPEAIEEERRLLYVAMTRARTGLTLMYVRKRFGKELPPSGFLGEILLPAAVLTPGTRIRHIRFGDGTVLSLDEDRLKVRFDRFLLTKTLSCSLCVHSMLITTIPAVPTPEA